MFFGPLVLTDFASAEQFVPENYVPDRLLIKFKEGIPTVQTNTILRDNDADNVLFEIEPIKLKIVRVPEEQLERIQNELARNPNVENVEKDFLFEPTIIPNDPKYQYQWHLDKIQASKAYLRGTGKLDEVLLKRVLYGISCRNYEAAAAAVPGAIGLSSSTVSRSFTHASAKQLKGLQERDLRELDIVAVFLDGKTFADMTMVVAVGITLTGEKHVLGFVETGTENESVLTPFLQELGERDCPRSKPSISSTASATRSARPPPWRSRRCCRKLKTCC